MARKYKDYVVREWRGALVFYRETVAALFGLGQQPHWGLLPPHALHQAQIPGRAICAYL